MFALGFCRDGRADVRVTTGKLEQFGTVLKIDSDITEKLASSFLVKFTPEIKTILINSRGGETSAGIKIAKLIQGKGLTLVVNERCWSACADIFVAAERKVMLRGAVVGWHGGTVNALSQIDREIDRTLLDIGDADKALSMAELLASEVSLYRKSGVDINFLYYSGLVSPALQERTNKTIALIIDNSAHKYMKEIKRKYEFWTPTIREMSAFGIENIEQIMNPDGKSDSDRILPARYYSGRAWTYVDHRLKALNYPMKFDQQKYDQILSKVTKLKYLISGSKTNIPEVADLK